MRPGDVADSSPHVVLSGGAQELTSTYRCPSETGEWWPVMEIDGGTGEVTCLGDVQVRER
ncbi:MAG: hypothetical protein WD993_08545 [Thermoleophilaceae bacterium]